jgi:hypothetical protein
MKTKFYWQHSTKYSYIKCNKNAFTGIFFISKHTDRQLVPPFKPKTEPGRVIFTSLWRTYLLKLVSLTILRTSQNYYTDDKMFPRLHATLLQEVPVKYKFNTDVVCKMTCRNESYKYLSPWQVRIQHTNKSETKKSHLSGHRQQFSTGLGATSKKLEPYWHKKTGNKFLFLSVTLHGYQ